MCGWLRSTCGYCSSGCTSHSGFEEDLADGECKAECNTALCAFDAGDCVLLTQGFCASGCFQHMLGDGTCQAECLSKACGNDAGDCDASACRAECFPYMVGDGQCDEACHAEACQWDAGDCDCSAGCTSALLSNDQCDSPCAIAACDFDRGRCECAPGCSELMKGDGVCNDECFTETCENDNGDCECAPGCLYSDVGLCKPECQVPECNYDMPSPTDLFCKHSPPSFDCSSVECYDEWGSFIENCDFTCEECGGALAYKMDCCGGCCSEHYFPHPAAASVCVRFPDRTTPQRPRVIYVGADPTGTYGAYPSLSAAFDSLFEKYVEVRLLPGTHEFSSSKYLIKNSYQGVSREQGKQVEALRQLKITSQSCVEAPTACVRPVVHPSTGDIQPFFAFSGKWSFEVSNVDFTSTFPKHLCIGANRSCGFRTTVFDLRDGMTAKFTSVAFRHFKRSLQCIIKVENATLELEDTDFVDVMLHGSLPDRGVIALLDSELTYTRGSVSLTNNLWDYGTQPRSAGALSAIRGRVAVSGVSFTHNFMALAIDSSFFASLIHLRDCWRVRIADCDFAFNVGRKGAVIGIFTFQWGSITRNYETTLVAQDSLIEVANCTFRNNTGTVGSSIYVHYLSGQQNIWISNCTFLSEFAEERSVIAGYSRLATSATREKSRAGARYPVPRLSLTHSQFRNCGVGQFGLVALNNIWSVRIEGIAVEEAEASDARNASTNSLQVLRTIPGAHFPKFDPSSSPQPCQSLFNSTESASLEIDSTVVIGSKCSTVVAATGLAISISGSYFAWNRGTATLGNVVRADGSSVTLQDSVFEGNGSPDCKGTVYLTGTAVTITGSHFRLNSASQGAALYLDKVLSANVRECSFEHNAAGMGGAVFVEGRAAMVWRAGSSVFRNNTAASNGGAIYVTASVSFSVEMSLVGVVFEECRSTTGSALFVSEGVVFLPGTQFQQCRFTENVASKYGSCVFESTSGEIAFSSCQFERNVGDFTSALYIAYSHSQSTLVLTDTLFDGNEAPDTVVVSSASLVGVAGSAVTCQGNAGTCLSLNRANFTCSRCSFVRNSAASGAALQLRSTEAACEDCDFQRNTAEFTGGAVLVKSYSRFACRRCQFLNNSAQWQGGALFVAQQSSVFLHTAAFSYNAAGGGAFAVYLILSDTESFIQFSRFTSNRGTSYGCISLISASLRLEECDFSENYSADSMGGLMLAQSAASIQSCRFTSQTGVLGVFIYAVDSNATMSNSLLSHGTATNAGAAIALFSSRASLSYSSFEALTSSLGGAFIAQDGSTLSVDSCSFRHIYSHANRGVFTVIRSVLSLSNTSVSEYSQGGVYGQQASVDVVGCSFTNGTAGSGVACSECALVAIRDCAFQWLAADQGAGVYLEGGSEFDSFRVTDSEFHHCRGESSGAIYVEEYPGSIANCLFLNNSGDEGGAIHIAKSSLPSAAISVIGNRFYSNSAKRGGSICWDATQPLLQDNEFSSNTATYGPDFAAFAVRLALKRESYESLVNVTSGKSLAQPLVFELLDPYGQVVADDNESEVQLSASDIGTTVSGEVRAQAKGGQFFIAHCFVTAQPGTNTSITIKASAIEGESSLTIPVQMRYCRKGEYLAMSQCVPCAAGTYSLTNHSSCASCPSNALCFGNFSIAPRAGYWRASPDTDTFFKCPNAAACLGSHDGSSPTGDCADGYEGAKCQACAPGHSQWGAIHCSKCRDSAARIGLHALISAILTSAVGAIVAIVLRSTRESVLVLYIKIFVNYAQVVMLFRSSGLAWPQEVLQLFNAYEVLGAFPEYVVSADCVMESFDERLVAMALVLPALMLLILLVWGAATRGSRRSLQDEFVSAAATVSFLAYPSVVWTLVESFRCEKVGSGEYWLLQHNLQCWTPRHMKYALGLALPCIILFTVALPGTALAFLRRSQQRSGSVRFQYARLGYYRKRWYWEFVVLYWKILVIACFSLLLHVSPLFPALTVFGALVAGVLGAGRRFQKSEFDSLETHSLVVCAVTLYIGLMLSTGVLNRPASTVPWAVILTLNVYFVSLLIWRVCKLLHRRILKRRHSAAGPEPRNKDNSK